MLDVEVDLQSASIGCSAFPELEATYAYLVGDLGALGGLRGLGEVHEGDAQEDEQGNKQLLESGHCGWDCNGLEGKWMLEAGSFCSARLAGALRAPLKRKGPLTPVACLIWHCDWLVRQNSHLKKH